MELKLVFEVGLAGTAAAFLVCRRAARRTGRWQEYLAAYAVAVVALSGPLLVKWYETPVVDVATAMMVVLLIGLLHLCFQTLGETGRLGLLKSSLSQWRALWWLLLTLVVLYPLAGPNVIVLIGVGLLFFGARRPRVTHATPLPPLNRLRRRSPQEGVIGYREWP